MSVIGQQANPNGSVSSIHTEKLNKQLVVENVTVVEVTKRIEVPILVEVPREQIRYVTVDQETIKYIAVLEDTVRFVKRDEETVKFNVRESETIKYVVKEVETERPKFVEKLYEIPVKKEVIIEVISIQNMEEIKNLAQIIPDVVRSMNTAVFALREDLASLQKEVNKLRGTKLVEDVIRVPKIEYTPVEVERVIWKDVIRERPV